MTEPIDPQPTNREQTPDEPSRGQTSDAWLARLPHQPPMRLVETVLDVQPGREARCRRVTRPDDWFFQGHFPGLPVVPAIVLVEFLAQTGGLAARSAHDAAGDAPVQLRVAAFGSFKFPRAAGPGMTLEAVARLERRMGTLYRIEGEVTADGAIVATGSLTLAQAPATTAAPPGAASATGEAGASPAAAPESSASTASLSAVSPSAASVAAASTDGAEPPDPAS